MTPAEVIAQVRELVQDTDTPYRYSDAVLLAHVNEINKRIAILRPDLFSTVADFTTTPDSSVQSLPADALRLLEIFHVKGGVAIEEVDRDTFTRLYPMWPSVAAGTPTKYMRHARNPTRYFLFPKPSAGVELVGEYVVSPPDYLLGDDMSLDDAYFPAVVDGVVFLVEAVDNEHANSGRAKAFYDSMLQLLGASAEANAFVDVESNVVEGVVIPRKRRS